MKKVVSISKLKLRWIGCGNGTTVLKKLLRRSVFSIGRLWDPRCPANFKNKDLTYLKVQNYIDTDTFPDTFQNSAKFQVDYSSSTQGDIPIITLVDDVSSWEVGDQIMVASTSFEVRESETFTIVECQECTANQVKLDRPATFTHWGRIDTDSGIIDQRAEVGLLSRNVRFYGEMSSTNCQYALTRESLDSNSPNNGVSWCRIGLKSSFCTFIPDRVCL